MNVLGFLCVAGCWILNFGRDELVLLLCEKNWFSVYVVRALAFLICRFWSRICGLLDCVQALAFIVLKVGFRVCCKVAESVARLG